MVGLPLPLVVPASQDDENSWLWFAHVLGNQVIAGFLLLPYMINSDAWRDASTVRLLLSCAHE